MSLPKIAVFISGNGSDLQAIIDAIHAGELHANIAVVISDKNNAYGLERAKKYNIPAVSFIKKEYESIVEFEKAILECLKAYGVEHIILAGFMKILSPYFIEQYRNKIINIHPSLLPSFPGAHAHRDVLAYGVKITGCTIHFVDEGMDTGPIIAQSVVKVLENDTEDTLRNRVLEIEHSLYPQVIEKYLQNKYVLKGRKVIELN